MHPFTKRFWLLFTLSFITCINSQNVNVDPTPYPTPNPTPNPTSNSIQHQMKEELNSLPLTTSNPTSNPLSNKPCCQCTTDRTSTLEPHPPSGCPQDIKCATEICSIKPSCCDSNTNNGWNEQCANIAQILCDISNPITCCQCTTETLGISGCNINTQCENIICQLNDYNTCCTNEWSLKCANISKIICNLNTQITPPNTLTTVYQTTLEPSTNPTKTSSVIETLATIETFDPTPLPTPNPTPNPTPIPTNRPSNIPTIISNKPSNNPSIAPSITPSNNPTIISNNPSNNPSIAPSNKPTNKPSNNPTIYNVPSDCNDQCDAFSVRVMDYELYENNVSITYKINRLFSDGICKKSIKYIVLGLCDQFPSELCSDIDINGLINNFEPIVNRRILNAKYSASDDSISSSNSNSNSDSNSAEIELEIEKEEEEFEYRMVWGTNSEGELTGIRINIDIEKEFEFKINLRNVFIDEPSLMFSNNIRFLRGKKEFNCNNMFLQGLPCLNENKFISGEYNNNGYNIKTKQFDINSKFINGQNALVIDKNEENSSWGALSELDPYILYSLISIFIVFVLLMFIVAIYVSNKWNIRRCDSDEINNQKTQRVNTNEDVNEDDIDLFSITGNDIEEMEDHSLVRFNGN